MLKNCLESLIEQCRIFQYGGFTFNAHGRPVYNKISAFIIDDSKDENNIRKIREICSGTADAGLRTYYIGLDEQTELLSNLPFKYREKLQDLLRQTRQPGAASQRRIDFQKHCISLAAHIFG